MGQFKGLAIPQVLYRIKLGNRAVFEFFKEPLDAYCLFVEAGLGVSCCSSRDGRILDLQFAAAQLALKDARGRIHQGKGVQ